MAGLGTLMKAVDTAMSLREAAKRIMAPPGEPAQNQPVPRNLETTLTNVVVAALKEAFDRDHARLELERRQLEEERRRAEETLRLELRRQAIEREVARLRMLAGAAVLGWVVSMLLFALRGATLAMPARATLAVGWALLLGALGAAFHAQGALGAADHRDQPVSGGTATASLWLLVAGFAATAMSLLF